MRLPRARRGRRIVGALPVHAFDQRETLLGQATLGLELDSQAPDLDTLLVAVGGGGLIGGIAAWYAAAYADRRCRAGRAPTLTRRWRPAAGRRAGRRHRRRFAGAAPGRPADVPDRASLRRARGAGDR